MRSSYDTARGYVPWSICENGLRHLRQRPSRDSLYEGYRGKVHRVIPHLVQSPSDAEDLTQETFFKVQKRFPHLKHPDRVSSWLFRIATNTALDFLRQSASSRARGAIQLPMESAQAIPSDAPSPAAALDTTESVSCVREHAHQLPEQYRVVLVLHDLEGLSMQRVAEVMGSSMGATKVRLHRARRRFAEICGAECEQFYNEQGVLSCQPRSTISLISADISCCGPGSPDCSCASDPFLRFAPGNSTTRVVLGSPSS